MGWKLTGIVINKSYDKNIIGLFDLLDILDFDLVKDSTFEEEISQILENDKLSIGFFGSGTFLSTGIELMTNEEVLKKASSNQNLLAFYVNETTSTYCFDYFSNGQYLRRKWISYSDNNIDSNSNFGDKIQIEKDEEDDMEIIFKLIGQLLGKGFYEIDEGEQMFCFTKNVNSNRVNLKQGKGFWKKLFG